MKELADNLDSIPRHLTVTPDEMNLGNHSDDEFFDSFTDELAATADYEMEDRNRTEDSHHKEAPQVPESSPPLDIESLNLSEDLVESFGVERISVIKRYMNAWTKAQSGNEVFEQSSEPSENINHINQLIPRGVLNEYYDEHGNMHLNPILKMIPISARDSSTEIELLWSILEKVLIEREKEAASKLLLKKRRIKKVQLDNKTNKKETKKQKRDKEKKERGSGRKGKVADITKNDIKIQCQYCVQRGVRDPLRPHANRKSKLCSSPIEQKKEKMQKALGSNRCTFTRKIGLRSVIKTDHLEKKSEKEKYIDDFQNIVTQDVEKWREIAIKSLLFANYFILRRINDKKEGCLEGEAVLQIFFDQKFFTAIYQLLIGVAFATTMGYLARQSASIFQNSVTEGFEKAALRFFKVILRRIVNPEEQGQESKTTNPNLDVNTEQPAEQAT
ncbi:hypothetical protein BDA99DRAFT_562533 [Phascolomyces articulosus]|uniref:Uncharacterized protein n=1 Tax=Phascolomyces articulosus TaxID=60185 RepID=A0AAD5PBA8_9FUNG|nr:hypothetical protein BDA99DRAFT_562533 [Phascolomyces articulosus]